MGKTYYFRHSFVILSSEFSQATWSNPTRVRRILLLYTLLYSTRARRILSFKSSLYPTTVRCILALSPVALPHQSPAHSCPPGDHFTPPGFGAFSLSERLLYPTRVRCILALQEIILPHQGPAHFPSFVSRITPPGFGAFSGKRVEKTLADINLLDL